MIGPPRKTICLLAAGLLAPALVARAPADEPGRGVQGGAAAPTHPIVPGFERFQAEAGADRVRAGLLLLGDLNCVSCHEAGPRSGAVVLRKQAPILDSVGGRVRPEFLRAFLADPHGTKPGTTMPDALAILPPGERDAAAESLTHFLASSGALTDAPPSRKAIPVGGKLYREVGCLACHGPLEGKAPRLASSVPLGPLASKYSVAGLAAFLTDPLKVRPSGRMPAMNLTAEEARNVASYLLKDLRIEKAPPNLTYRYFEGDWSSLPDYSKLKPEAEGQVSGFDLGVADRKGNIGLRYSGFLEITGAGEYTFHLSSDDGSRLLIDGDPVVVNDGVHPAQAKSGKANLIKGMHRIEVEYFNAGGELELEVEYEGRGLARRPVESAVYLSDRGDAGEVVRASPGARFQADPDLAAKGRALFAKVGCASCHQRREKEGPIGTGLAATPLDRMKTEGGCLSPDHAGGTPAYHLDDRQRAALAAAIASAADANPGAPGRRDLVARAMMTFNCYACHRRDGAGGVEEGRDGFFETTQKEMGDEGRIPPALDGVGAKLAPDYLRHVVADGAKDRPYMLTRMPRFGGANVAPLVAAFGALDAIDPVEPPTFDEPARKVKAAGRFLAGGMALGCIKCHTFKGIKAEGVQAIDMAIMTRRLNHDWFHRYLADPQAYRPGTRMPGAWPMGKTMLPKVLDGSASKQIEAIWLFLSDGNEATEPYGLGREPMPLVAEGAPVLYRNFIKGGGVRAIGVGYPERANLAFDADDVRLAMIWQGDFIDASRHWTGRGEGFQAPLGDNVVSLPAGPAFATLRSLTDEWPSGRPKELGYRFLGYRLDGSQRPTFLYKVGPVRVEDSPEPVASKPAATLRRSLTLASDGPLRDLYFRAAVASRIVPADDGWFAIDDEWRVRFDPPARPFIRQSRGKGELLVPIEADSGSARIVEQFAW